jgi:thioredoxin-related protein
MIVFLFSFLIQIHAHIDSPVEESSEWLTNFSQATELAAEKNLPILMVFSGSDWCKPCIKLRQEVFDQPYFRKHARDHFVLLNLDFPRYKKNRLPKELEKHHSELADKYNPRGEFPLVLVLHQQEVIGRTGYSSGGAEKYLAQLIKLSQQVNEDQ